MTNNTKQMQGSAVGVDWTIGRAPLALRGIRFADGDDGAPIPPVPAPPAAPPVPAPPVPTPPAPVGYSADYVKDLRGEAKAHREAKEAADKTAAELQAKYDKDLAELETLRGDKAKQARVSALTTAANGVADVDALLDSQLFANATAGVDMGDAAAAKAAVTAFVTENPRFAATPQQGRPAPRQQGAPSGGGAPHGAPTSLKGALNAHFTAR